MVRRIPALVFLLSILLSIPLFAQPVTRETVLPNRMKVIIREDHTAPVVSLMVWVGVGSRNETDANRGISHFIEHLLFKGTKKRAVGDISREVSAMGGRINAATSYDFTQFYVEVGSRYFNNALDIFSDVIQNSSFDPAEVEKERSVVQEEVRMYLDDPGRRLWYAYSKEAFMLHPYRNPIAGSVQSVQNIKRQQILDYFHQYYIPNNMVVVVVGDVNADDALRKITQSFADFPKGTLPAGNVPKEPVQHGIRTVTDRMDINQAYLMMGFQAPTIESPDSYALEVMSQILGSGRTSRLYQALREDKQLAYDVDFGYSTFRDNGLLVSSAAADPSNVKAVTVGILKQIEKLKTNGVTQTELNRAKAKILSDWAFSHETYEQQSDEIGYYTIIGDPSYPTTYVNRINQVTAADVQRVARKYLKPDSYTLAFVLPKAKESQSKLIPHSAVNAKGSDTATPKATTEPSFLRLENGLRVITRESHNADVVSAQLLINVGTKYETSENNGIVTLMQETISKGTATRSSRQIANILESAGVQLSTDGGDDYSTIAVKSTRRGLDTGLEILADLAKNASFPSVEVERDRKLLLNAIAQQENDPESYAAKLFQENFYQKHPYHLNALGTPQSVKSITRQNLLDFYHRFYQPENMVLVVAGNFDTASLTNKIKELFGSMVEGTPPAKIDVEEPIKESPLVVTREKEAQQAILILGIPAPPIGNPDYAALKVLNTALGGGMSSILFDEVREKQGLAYVVSSIYPGKNGPSFLMIQSGTKPTTVDAAKNSILATLKSVADKGINAKQFEEAKRFYLGNFDLSHQTAEDQAGFLGAYEIRGIGYRYDTEFPKQIEKVTLADVNRVAKKYLSNNGYTLVVVKPTVSQAK